MCSTPSLLALRTKWNTYQHSIINVSTSRSAVVIIRADEHTFVNFSHAKLHRLRDVCLCAPNKIAYVAAYSPRAQRGSGSRPGQYNIFVSASPAQMTLG